MGKYSATLMIFLSFGTIVARAVFVFHEDGCHGWPSDGPTVQLLRMVYMILFAGQSASLCAIFFSKLVYIFEGSLYEISRCTRWLYNGILISFPVYIVLTATVAWSLEKYFAIVFMLWIIIMMTSLLALFINKLLVINRDCTKQSTDALNAFVNDITKVTLLTVISVSVTMLNVLISGIQYFVWQTVAFRFIPILDVFTNFLCVMFCFPAFTAYYTSYCTCADRRCKRVLKRAFGRVMAADVLAKQMEMDIVSTGSSAHAVNGRTAGNSLEVTASDTTGTVSKTASSGTPVSALGSATTVTSTCTVSTLTISSNSECIAASDQYAQ